MMFSGILTALVTPFDVHGGVAYERLKDLIRYQIESGVRGIVLLGTTGESPTISDEEAEEILRVGVAAAGKVPVIAGCSSNDTAQAVARAKRLSALDVAALLVLTPYYNRANENGLVAHFEAVAAASEKPLILYHVPGRTGCRMTVGALRRLKSNANIRGVKEASGDIGTFTAFAAEARGALDLLCGSDEMALPALALGASGLISVLSNLLPRAVCEMFDRFAAGDIVSARRIAFDLAPLTSALFTETNPIPVKAAMNALGFGVGGYRLPLCAMGEANRRTLLGALNEVRARGYVS